MIDDKYIIEHFLGKTDKINRFALQRITEEELNYLKNRYNDSDSLNETILRIKYNIDVHPHCKTCGKKIKFYYSRKKHNVREYCSRRCIANSNDVREKTKKTCLEKYKKNKNRKKRVKKIKKIKKKKKKNKKDNV